VGLSVLFYLIMLAQLILWVGISMIRLLLVFKMLLSVLGQAHFWDGVVKDIVDFGWAV